MLNTRLLRQFIAVAEELNYTRAAQRAGIAQSPLSQAIQRLESHLGTQLFLRNKRSVALTPAGKVFLQEAYHWLRYEAAVLERTRSANEGTLGAVAMGFIGSVGYGFMPDLVARFRRRRPGVRLRLAEMTSRDQIEQLKRRDLDVGLLRTPLPSNEPQLCTQPFARHKLMAALPSQHRLAQRASLDVAELAGEAFIAFSRDKVPASHAQLLSVCAAAGFQPAIEQEASQIASVICVVAAGLCVALVPGNLASLIHPKVRYVPLSHDEPALYQEISLAWRHGDDNPALHALLELAREFSDEMTAPARAPESRA
ncbi:LysR family transcriptional regulator [Verticiella sediminum]|uniref:LysR family transcriptional regulator n=1 Tax=Verticiella sediminum TaxID=1247510 RepID=A0A556ACD7_9BURK|nr:LysR family transcriptional regulator [Verticiella sediminum]TSH90549.1 LysR family transcriptional regulator [Verticiella sediminum]